MVYINSVRIKKPWQLPLLLGALTLLFFSCDTVTDSSSVPPMLDAASGNFWALDFSGNSAAPYSLQADLLAEGQYCNIWVEKGSGVPAVTARNIANTFDKVIYPEMTAAFGYSGDINYDGQVVHGTMGLAGLLGNGDGKLCILLLDIKDNYRKGVNDSYTAGYFWYNNFLNVDYSNRLAMIYIDTNPGQPGSTESNATIAHEMQHLMNYVSSIAFRPNQMDTWIDEGLSSAAEWLYTGQQRQNRYGWYENDQIGNQSGLIESGNNFFVWGNHADIPYAILDDYATVYLFFQWLRLQSGSTAIYDDIITSSDYDFEAVTKAAAARMSGQGYDDWGTLLKTWLAANYINARSGKYGYMNDPVLKNIKAKTVAAGINSLSLAPGEGVYSLIPNGSSFNTPNPKSGYINYVRLSATSISETLPYAGGPYVELLTFNANSNNQGKTETGLTTGNADIDIAASGRSMESPQLSGPFPISGWDMLNHD